MKYISKLSTSVFDEKNKCVSIGKLDTNKISFIQNIDNKIGKHLIPDKDIVLWEDRIKHIERHKNDFSTDFLYDTCLENIPDIIQNPDYIGVHPKNNSLLFIRDYSQHISIAIKVSIEGNMSFRTMYPLMEAQLENYIRKERVKKFLTK